MSNPKCFITIQSQDSIIQKLQAQIEKSLLLNMWIDKADALLNRYIQTLDELDVETDGVRRGIKIEACESYFMSSIIHFHRCFVDQPTMHLQIEQVTDDGQLRDCYAEVLALRNHEFIHWKGFRSSIEVAYSFEPINPTQVNLAEKIQGQFKDSIGPKIDIAPLRKLYKATSDYVEQRRLTVLAKMRQRLADHEAFMKTQFLNENGESVIKSR